MYFTISPNELGRGVDLTRDPTPQCYKGERGQEIVRAALRRQHEDRISKALRRMAEARRTFNRTAHAEAQRELFAAMDSAA